MHEKELIFSEKRKIIRDFDESIYSLCSERITLKSAVNADEICLMILLQEHNLLRDFEENECALNKKLETQQKDRTQVSIFLIAMT